MATDAKNGMCATDQGEELRMLIMPASKKPLNTKARRYVLTSEKVTYQKINKLKI